MLHPQRSQSWPLTALGSQLNGDGSSAGVKRWVHGGDALTVKGMSLGLSPEDLLWQTWHRGQMEASELVFWVLATLWWFHIVIHSPSSGARLPGL